MIPSRLASLASFVPLVFAPALARGAEVGAPVTPPKAFQFKGDGISDGGFAPKPPRSAARSAGNRASTLVRVDLRRLAPRLDMQAPARASSPTIGSPP